MKPTPLPELNSVTWRQFGLAPGFFLAGTGLLMQVAQFMVDTARWFGEPMTSAECERMWQEFRAIGRALGIKEHHMPTTWADAQEWCHELLHTRLEASRSTQDVLDSISAPARPTRLIPNPLWALIARPAGHLLRLTTVGTMPPELRTRMGLRGKNGISGAWNASHVWYEP